jgi:uridine kinase
MTTTRIIAVAGGTASGKTTLAKDLVRIGGAGRVQIIPLDAYYRCSGHLSLEERNLINYDHPDVFEIALLEQHLAAIREGEAVEVPQYDFPTHSRSKQTQRILPSEVVLVEGILALHYPALRRSYSASVFVDAPDELRYARRLSRDVRERGRTEESVHYQWKTNVQPMHIEFCTPTKSVATEVFNGTAWTDDDVRALFGRLVGEASR